MSSKNNLTETEILERYRVAFENVANQTEIASIMAEFGFDPASIAGGKTIYEETRQSYDFNKQEDDETSEAYSNFSTKKALLERTYKLHRKKAKVIFRNQPETLKKLEIDGSMPLSYTKWLEMVKKFYKVSLKHENIQQKLIRLKVTTEHLIATDLLIDELGQSRSFYLREKGESQDATKQKDAAFDKIDDWMSEFYAVAKIALEDNPQLLEALGLIVRS